MLSIEEIKEMIKHLPAIAAKNSGVQMLIKFVGKTVHAVNSLDQRLKTIEEHLGIKKE